MPPAGLWFPSKPLENCSSGFPVRMSAEVASSVFCFMWLNFTVILVALISKTLNCNVFLLVLKGTKNATKQKSKGRLTSWSRTQRAFTWDKLTLLVLKFLWCLVLFNLPPMIGWEALLLFLLWPLDFGLILKCSSNFLISSLTSYYPLLYTSLWKSWAHIQFPMSTNPSRSPLPSLSEERLHAQHLQEPPQCVLLTAHSFFTPILPYSKIFLI